MNERELTTARDLLAAAETARQNAYVPYSRFAVGAALLCADGSVVSGCNVENAAYPLTNCAERTAIFAAVAAGKRDFSALAIVGGTAGKPADTFCPPCGACRQVLREFCGNDFPVYLKDGDKIVCRTLSQLLPDSFGPETLA